MASANDIMTTAQNGVEAINKLKSVIAASFPLFMITGTNTPVLVGNLPAAPSAGARMFVSDATATAFDSIVAGGGANTVPVFYDGTNWRIG